MGPTRRPDRRRKLAGAEFEGLVVVVYDIRSHRLRARVASALRDFGGLRVQKSVFECELTATRLAALRARLVVMVTSPRDSLRYYRLCEACRGRVEGSDVRPAVRPAVSVIV